VVEAMLEVIIVVVVAMDEILLTMR